MLFHAAIAERDEEGYDLDAVAETLNRKLIDRHPHVFGDRGYLSVEELHAEWERLKEDAAGRSADRAARSTGSRRACRHSHAPRRWSNG
ncbi:MazG nucleotide pyrophosphohydrolase domain-containing protein [Leucobacter soli]|uniref:MazG nucleotide pyrophosphohydrolase domain-containing protein n=1 Tax=Leucobacter soli TaxID=2812850 RepID=UPI00360F54C4